MKKHFAKFLRHFVVLLIAVLFLGGGPVKFGQENTFFHGFLIKNPIIRVGLGVNLGDVEISSSSGMKIYEVKSNYKLIADDVKKALLRGHKEKLDEKFLIQVAQRENQEEADVLAHDLRDRRSVADPNRGFHQPRGNAGFYKKTQPGRIQGYLDHQ